MKTLNITNLWAAQTISYDAFLGRRDFLDGNRSTPGYHTAALQAGLRGLARSVARFSIFFFESLRLAIKSAYS
jgi:hypothetical protein